MGLGEIFKLFGTIGLNDKEANEGIDKTTGKAKDSASKITGFFKNAAKAIGAFFVGGKLIDFGKSTIEAAASAKAIQAQFEQVFGNVGSEAQKTIEKMGKSFGMLPNRLKEPFTTTTSMFKGLGLSTEEAMKQAEIAVTLAADAAAFYDKSYEDANSALNSFIKGNYEGGEAIGLFANETQMAAWASKNLGVDWKNLDEAGKQVARLEYATAMQEAAGATGQASRESEGYENQMGNLKQAWTDFMVIIGSPVLDNVVTGLQKLTNGLQTAGEKVQQFSAWAKDNETTLILMGIGLGTLTALIITYNIQQALATAGTTLWGVVAGTATTVTTALGAAFAFLTSPIALAVIAIGSLIAIGVLLYKNWDTIKAKASEIWENVTQKFNSAKESIGTIIENLRNTVTTKFNQIKSTITTPINNAISTIKNGIGSGVSWITSKFNSFRSTVSGIFNRVKSAITGPINDAITTIKGWLSRLKLPEIKIPKIKLPHFSISGKFDLVPPGLSVPKINVRWYDEGGIFRNPAIIGVAERRPEFVGALDDLRYIVRDELQRNQPVVATAGPEVHLHIGTLVADDMGLKKLEQTLRKYRIYEDQRRGGA
jgi:hypothetical protein